MGGGACVAGGLLALAMGAVAAAPLGAGLGSWREQAVNKTTAKARNNAVFFITTPDNIIDKVNNNSFAGGEARPASLQCGRGAKAARILDAERRQLVEHRRHRLIGCKHATIRIFALCRDQAFELT